jgi:dethiobiotin synthetase
VYFVTGTGTGVGKTVLSAWWTAWLRDRGVRVRAVKPLASGGRADARRLQQAQGGGLPLDAVNPWWFRAALTPLVAARREGRRVEAAEVLAFLGSARKAADVLVIEGAGGLCSPLGEGWDARDLIVALDAIPVVVAANRLGVLNEVRLTLEALPARFARRTAVALMAPTRPGVVARTNAEVLEGWYGAERVIRFPWIEEAAVGPEPSRWPAGLRRALAGWTGNGGRGPLR